MSEPSLSVVMNRPFNEQTAFFRQKLGNLVPTARWDDLTRSEHDSGFMIAGATKADLLSDIATAVDRTITEGKGIGEFRRDFRSIVEKNGWHGWTGEGTAAGRAWRTRVIYRTNAQTSYAAGRFAQLREGNFTFWIYRHNDSVRNPRREHLGWNGLTLPADHPFWATHYPPNGWGCRCYVVGARRASIARRMGGDPDKALPEGWDATDPSTGAPAGIGQGWDYAPGASVNRTVNTMAEKVRHWDYQIAKGYMQGVPEQMRDQLATSYRSLPSVGDDARRYAQRVLNGTDQERLEPVRTLGLLTTRDTAKVADIKGQDVNGFDYSIDPFVVKHVQERHGGEAERQRGQRPVTPSDYALLPQLLNEGEALVDAGESRATNTAQVRRELTINGETFVAIFEIRRKRRTLALQTFYIRTGAVD